eukprot:365292-Chlamydomonas_euryale.AAC.8
MRSVELQECVCQPHIDRRSFGGQREKGEAIGQKVRVGFISQERQQEPRQAGRQGRGGGVRVQQPGETAGAVGREGCCR